MKTSTQWLQEVKDDSTKLNRWLSRQWLAETEAAERIAELATKVEPQYKTVLEKIAADETKHAELLGVLCTKRGLKESKDTDSRYYSQVNLEELSVDELCALGHHAEGMRLDRIIAICDDEDIDEDIRDSFSIILHDEIMHEKAFGYIASEEAKQKMKGRHDLGVAALGLVL